MNLLHDHKDAQSIQPPTLALLHVSHLCGSGRVLGVGPKTSEEDCELYSECGCWIVEQTSPKLDIVGWGDLGVYEVLERSHIRRPKWHTMSMSRHLEQEMAERAQNDREHICDRCLFRQSCIAQGQDGT